MTLPVRSKFHLKVVIFVLALACAPLLARTAATTSAAEALLTNPTPIAVPASGTVGPGAPYPSTIVVGLTGPITSVELTIHGFSHQFPDDVELLLVGPAGQEFLAMANVGGFAPVTNVTFTLSDSAANNIPSPLTSGTFRPTSSGFPGSLPPPAPPAAYGIPVPAGSDTFASVFNGTSAHGTWSLFAVDDASADLGLIAGGWSLRVTTGSPDDFISAVEIGGDQVCEDHVLTAANSTGMNVPASGTSGVASLYPSSVTVEQSGQLVDVNLTIIGITHEFPSDIALLLVGPDGRALVVLQGAGGGTLVTNRTITLDDDAAAFVPQTSLPNGTFLPTSYFGGGGSFPSPAPAGLHPTVAPAGTATLDKIFLGMQVRGTWSLFVVDTGTADIGSISGGWSLTITTRECAGQRARTNLGGAVGAIGAAAAQQAQENRARAAAAAAPQPAPAVAAPRVGTGIVTPPNTGDAGLARQGEHDEAVLLAAIATALAITIGAAAHREVWRRR